VTYTKKYKIGMEVIKNNGVIEIPSWAVINHIESEEGTLYVYWWEEVRSASYPRIEKSE
jgi:hypothetical protein